MSSLLDSYEAFKEEAYEAELFKLLVRISREGLSIGVHLLVTAGRQTNLRAQLYSNFKHQLSLPQNEAGEVRAIVGSTPLAMTMEDIKGRALMKREEVDVIQLALPVFGANDTQVLNNLRQGSRFPPRSLDRTTPKCHSDGARGVDGEKTSIAEPAFKLPMNTALCL